jgi:hypothetical protein
MSLSIILTAIAGGLLGVRHAFEPDHLAAMTTLAASPSGDSPRRKFRNFTLLGALWGVGHTIGLLSVVMILSLMNATINQDATQVLELVVAIMLVALGIRAIIKSYAHTTGQAPQVVHRHGDAFHRHAEGYHMHIRQRTVLWRPLLIGSVHGLAGSGAMLVLVATSIDSIIGRCMYVLMFGIGSTIGMSAITLASGAGFARLLPVHQARIARASGVMSIGIGCWWGAVAGAYF